MIAYAARYGHQSIAVLGDMFPADLTQLGEAVAFWVGKENEAGSIRRDGSG